MDMASWIIKMKFLTFPSVVDLENREQNMKISKNLKNYTFLMRGS